MAVQIQLRRDTASNWTGTNPVLAVGEPGVETDTLKVKVGDGATAWNSLAYSISYNFDDLNNKPTTLAGYGITDGGGNVTGSSTTTFTNKSGNISQWTNDSNYLTSVPAQSFSSLTGKPTTVAGYGITDALALGTTSTTALAGDTALLALGTTSTTALAGDSVLTDLGISDGSSGQVLTTDGSGGFTFATATAYATSTQGSTADSAIQPNTSPTLTNLTLTGYLAGPASFVIDPAAVGDDTGTVVIAGDLQVDGTQTTINSTTVAIDDLNFSIATDAADSAAANGAGISIGGAGATLVYTHATTSWDLNKQVNISENLSVGATPKAMQSGFDNIQVGGNLTLNVDSTGAGAGVYMGNNVYRDVTNSRWEYIYTDEASQYVQANGEHIFRQAVSGTADDAITWTTPVKIDASGNVGINADSPSADYGSDKVLEIKGASSPGLVINDTGQASKYGIHADSDDLKITYGTGTLATFQNDGKVGIGTSSPSETFHVQKAADDKLVYGSNPRLLLDTPTGVNGLRVLGDTTPFEFKIDSGTYNGSAFSMGGTGDVSLLGTTTTASDTFNDSPTFFFNSMRWNGSANATHFQGAIKGHTRSATNGDGYLGIGADANANHINIDTNGNVGIGDDSPSSRLTVKKNSARTTDVENMVKIDHTSSGTTGVGFGSAIYFLGERENGVTQGMGRLVFEAEVNSGTDISSGFLVQTATAGAVSTKLRVTHDGNVGIGNTPADKLDVQGADNGITVRSISANRPVITLVNDTTNMLQLSANGTYGAIGDGTDANRYFIFNDGDVGLAGVTDPRNKLHVGGAICNNKGVTNGTGIVQTVGRGMYHVLLTNNYGAGSNVRHAAYYVCVDYEGDDIVATNEIYNNNSMSVSFSISSGWLTVNSLPAGNNNVAVFGM